MIDIIELNDKIAHCDRPNSLENVFNLLDYFGITKDDTLLNIDKNIGRNGWAEYVVTFNRKKEYYRVKYLFDSAHNNFAIESISVSFQTDFDTIDYGYKFAEQKDYEDYEREF